MNLEAGENAVGLVPLAFTRLAFRAMTNWHQLSSTPDVNTTRHTFSSQRRSPASFVDVPLDFTLTYTRTKGARNQQRKVAGVAASAAN